MYELIMVSPHDGYIDCPAKIGVVTDDAGNAVLIDSGSDKDAGKKALKALRARNLTLQAVCLTHSHADHIGGCAYLQKETGCRIYAPGIEQAFTAFPLLESALLWGGNPPEELRNKFLMAQPSHAELLPQEDLPMNLKKIPLPGHSFEMVGYRTPDDTVYLADCLSSRETLEKYGIGYLVDPDAYIATLRQVKEMAAACFVPAHAPATPEIAELAQINIDAAEKLLLTIAELCADPVDFDTLLQRLFRAYNLRMTDQQHALIGSTLRSCLSGLKKQGRIVSVIEDERMLFRRAEPQQ